MTTGSTPITCFQCDRTVSKDQALKIISMTGFRAVLLRAAMPAGAPEPVICIDCVLSAPLDDWRFGVSGGLLRSLRDGVA